MRFPAGIAMLGGTVLQASLLAQTVVVTPVLDVHDDFEMPQLSNLWDTSRLELASTSLQTKIVRAGRQALSITVHPHDRFEAGQHGSADSERDELMEVPSLVPVEGRAQEYLFSMYFPQDFPIVPVRLVIAQWKQYCGDDSLPCSDDSPVLALRYIDGALRVTQDINHKTIILYEKKNELRGRWLDFKVQARFTNSFNGHIKVWLNDRQIVDHLGVTANTETAATGYASPSHFFFKMGLYRDVMEQPMTVYIDEYRKRDLHDGEL